MNERSEELIFAESLEKNPDERAAFLDQACAGRPELRQSVESLLEAYQHGAYLEPGENATIVFDSLADETGKQLGPYKLLQRIGEGGMGDVYMAEQCQPIKRRVALKIIKLGMDTKQIVARFEAERQALAMMDHPNIAKVLDAGATDNGRPYFVMELVRGIKITEYCDQNRLSNGERLELFRLICQAIQHAHQKGIIHRDIKPSNILVTLHDGVPVPKVIDFGIAKATQAELTEKTLVTQFHQLIGTPAYMSPEQAEMSALDVDTRADIYSLGVLLYELLTGKTPLDGKQLLRAGYEELLQRIKVDEPLKPSTKARTLEGEERTVVANNRRVDPSRLGNELRGDLDWIVMKTLEKDRTRRYETANALAMDITRHLTNEAVLARPPSAAYRFQKLLRRNKFVFAAIGAVALALVIGIVGSTSQAFRALRAEQEQVRLRHLAEQAAGQTRRHAYAADMRAADVAIHENNLGYAQGLLKRYSPAPGEEDLRGVEWRYLWQACRSDALKSFPHDAIVNQAVFSPDGRLVATASLDGMVRVWDVSSEKPVERFLGYDGEDPKHPLAFSPDGRYLACGHSSGVTIRETTDWTISHELEAESGTVLFSPNGKLLAFESEGRVKLWDTATSRTTPLETGAPSKFTFPLAFSTDSRMLAVSAGSPRRIQVFDVPSRSRVAEIDSPNAGSLALAPGGRWLFAGGGDGSLAICDLTTKQVVASYKLHASWLFGLAFSPGGDILATAGTDQVIHFWRWDVEPDGPPTLEKVQSLKGHGNEIWFLDFTRDGRFLVSSGKDGTAKVWSTTVVQQGAFPWDAGSDQQLLGFSADGTRLHTIALKQRQIWSWKVENLEQPVSTFEPPTEAELRTPESQGPAVILCDDDSVVFGTANGTVQAWDLQTGRAAETIRVGNGMVFPLGVSPDKRLVFVWDVEERLAGLWNFQTGEREAVFPDYGSGSFRGNYYSGYVDFSPDGQYLAYPGLNHKVQLWGIEERRVRFTLKGHKWVVFAPRFSPDSKLLATSSWDGTAKLWDVDTGDQSVPTLSGHRGGPTTVFASDGRTLLTSAAFDGMTQFWNVATGKQMLTLHDADECHLSPDGQTLIYRQSGTFRVLRLQSLAEIDPLHSAAQVSNDPDADSSPGK